MKKKRKLITKIADIIKLLKEFIGYFILGRCIQELLGMENEDSSLESFEKSGNFC